MANTYVFLSLRKSKPGTRMIECIGGFKDDDEARAKAVEILNSSVDISHVEMYQSMERNCVTQVTTNVWSEHPGTPKNDERT